MSQHADREEGAPGVRPMLRTHVVAPGIEAELCDECTPRTLTESERVTCERIQAWRGPATSDDGEPLRARLTHERWLDFQPHAG